MSRNKSLPKVAIQFVKGALEKNGFEAHADEAKCKD